MPQLSRQVVLQSLRQTLEPLDYTYAMWEGGSEVFGRTDEWSDIDLQVDVADDRVEETFRIIVGILEGLSPIEQRFDIPVPPDKRYAQSFFRLKEAGPFLLLDLVVFQHSAPAKFLEPEIHGHALFHFQKNDSIPIPHLDFDEQMKKIETKLLRMKDRFQMFHVMLEKELNRNNHLMAVDLYHRIVLDSLVDALRILHSPAHFDFKVQYLNHDLPKDVLEKLHDLFFVVAADDLRWKYRQAARWFLQTVEEMDLGVVRERLIGSPFTAAGRSSPESRP